MPPIDPDSTCPRERGSRPLRVRSDPTGGRRALGSGSRRLAAAALGLATAVVLGVAAAPSRAVLISTGNGTGNTTAPNPDAGFARIGSVNGLSAVYVRNGWVLTAAHVGEGDFLLGSTTHRIVPGSTVRFSNPDTTQADLIAFKLRTRPPLADLPIANAAPTVATLVTLIGNGLDRGAATSWSGLDGWSWGGAARTRWGTNRIASVGELALSTQAFRVVFDEIPNPPAGQHEADVVVGDSGGGAFTGSGASTRLVGILFAHATFVGQPANTSLYGNAGLIVDLFAYRDAILATTDRPDCSDGLDVDGDGSVDHPDDPGCSAPSDASEREATLVCDNGLDDDADSTIDHPADPGCADGEDPSERTAARQCDNGFDDDGDLAIDYPADPGCLHPSNPIEAPEPARTVALAAGVASLMGAARRRARRA